MKTLEALPILGGCRQNKGDNMTYIILWIAASILATTIVCVFLKGAKGWV